MPVDEVKKKHRGFFDHVRNDTVYVCRWNDNAVVTLASNHLTHHPAGSMRDTHSRKRSTELHKDGSTALSHLDFRKDITTHFPRAKSQLTIQTGRRAHPPETLRITEGDYLEPISQGRCRVCKKIADYIVSSAEKDCIGSAFHCIIAFLRNCVHQQPKRYCSLNRNDYS
ncbi:hypothetical protein T02_5105 [Trichinella nativa]|uniref:PiggyBac transposable element-derived protein 3 n=1 Tax=Trichinella nativa TaxID=6335 RepID=A0A0V1LU26_9BILA|nr:hypothetical protein T02_5105 [Trichinella nativa]